MALFLGLKAFMKKYIGIKKRKRYRLFVIKLILPSQGAAVMPPMGPQVAQTGVSALEFCEKFNERTKELDLEVGALIAVLLFITPLKNFFIELKMPLTLYLIRYGLGLEGIKNIEELCNSSKLSRSIYSNRLIKKVQRMYDNFFFMKLKRHKSYNKKLFFLKQFYFFYIRKNKKNKIINSKMKYIKRLCLQGINRLFLKNNFINFFDYKYDINKLLKSIENKKDRGLYFKETKKKEKLIIKNKIYSDFLIKLHKYICKLEEKYKYISYAKNNYMYKEKIFRDPINKKNLLYYYRGKVRDVLGINPLFSRKIRILIVSWEVAVIKSSFMEKDENFFCITFNSFFYITILQNYKNYAYSVLDSGPAELSLENRYKKNRKRNVSK